VEKNKVGSLHFGHWGEDLAADYLKAKGYEIIEKHFFFHHTEIDLIARHGDYLVLVEVKTRSSAEFGPPEEALTSRKKACLRRAAEGYLYLNHLDNIDCRFDVISISFKPDGSASIEHLENAFE